MFKSNIPINKTLVSTINFTINNGELKTHDIHPIYKIV